MLILETVVRVRREHAEGESIKAIARDLRLSRKVVRKAIRAPEAEFTYRRAVQPLPRIGPFQERLDALLAENEARPRRERVRMTRLHDLLLREGFEGSYDAVRRYVARWKIARRKDAGVAYADRIVVRLDDEVIAEHPRSFGRDRMILDPWHYLPVLARKPGALRNGAPFQGWELPPALARLRRKLGPGDDADRRFVRVLSAVRTDGLDAVEEAIREALDSGAASDDVILNILARRREPPRPPTIGTSEALMLHPPIADCARYDLLRGARAAA